MLYTLIEHALSTNDSARYIWTLLWGETSHYFDLLDIRPISLTLALSKLSEDFVASIYVGQAILEKIDLNSDPIWRYSKFVYAACTHLNDT